MASNTDRTEHFPFVVSEARRLRCVAGPGTGKTRAIEDRVQRLLERRQVAPSRIFAVTFTRNAAGELGSRLKRLKVVGAEDLLASTLHSFALKLLSEGEVIERLGRHPRLCFPSELVPFYHDVAGRVGGTRSAKRLLKDFESMWARLQKEIPGRPDNAVDRAFEDGYKGWMRFHRAMAVGELIPLSVRYLAHNPASPYIGRFDHVLVDEYQDLNRADQTLVGQIAGTANIAIAGDDDQSIFGFRNAYPEGIRTWLDEQKPPKQDVQLNICKRCDGRIVHLANAAIAENSGRLRGEMSVAPGKEDLGEVSVIQWNTRLNETRGVAKGIAAMVESGILPQSEEALVLVPRNEFAAELGQLLEEQSVPGVQVHTKPDWDNRQLGEAVSYLRLSIDIKDRVALRYLLGSDQAAWRRDQYSRLREWCEDHDRDPGDVLSEPPEARPANVSALAKRWASVSAKVGGLSKMSESQLLNELLPQDGPTAVLGKRIRRLRAESEDASLSDLLVDAVVRQSDDRSDLAPINIMTYWGAKGLTCDTAIVTSLVDGILPRKRDPQTKPEEADLAEKRRLFYVCVTRAKHRLVLSSFRKVTIAENKALKLGLSGEWRYLTTRASLFLEEIAEPTPTATRGEDWLAALGA